MKHRLLRVVALGLALGLCIPSVSSYVKSGERVEVSDDEGSDESDETEDIESDVEEDEIDYDEDAEEDDSDDESDDTEDAVADEENEDTCEDDEDSVDEDIVSDFVEVEEEEILPDEILPDVEEDVDGVEDEDCVEEDGAGVSENEVSDGNMDSGDDVSYSDSCESTVKPYIEVDSVVIHYNDGTKQKIPSKEVYSDGSLTIPCSCSSKGTYEDSSNTHHKYNKRSLICRVSSFLEGMDIHCPDGLLKVDGRRYKIVSCKMGDKYSHKVELKSGKNMESLDTHVGEMNHTYFGGSFVETIGGVTVDVFAVPEDMDDGLFTSKYIEGRF